MLDRSLSPPRSHPDLKRPDGRAAGWALSPGRVGYLEAVAAMEARAAAIAEGSAGELVWLLEHPPLYTAGVSAKPEELIDAGGLPVFPTRRGGRHTYHGPGQRVAYVMLDLRERGRDIRAFVAGLEAWIIDALAAFGVEGVIRQDRVGVWVETKAPGAPLREEKIAAIGVRVRQWISFHGVSLNVEPDLAHFAGIIPCGVREHGVTSLVALGRPVGMDEADAALKASFRRVFGPIAGASPPI